MKKNGKKQNKKIISGVLKILLPIAAVGVIGYAAYNFYKLEQLGGMTVEDMLAYTAKGKEEARISVGIVKDGESQFTVYGKDGAVLPAEERVYEIGSITKTFTAALLAKAVGEGKISLSDTIDMYLPLPQDKPYPTISQLATHTSGYKSEYIDLSMALNTLRGVNPFKGINEEALMERLSETKLRDKTYPFKYSNFGVSVLGLVLEKVYDDKYSALMDSYCAGELKLSDTRVSNGTGVLENCWEWDENDAYMPAGAIISTMTDMLRYARMNIEESPSYLSLAHAPIKDAESSNAVFEKMGIHIDSVGMTWITDKENNIIWHNGATGSYNSYLGFDKKNGLAVVVLSNLPPEHRIPATVIGARLLRDLQSQSS